MKIFLKTLAALAISIPLVAQAADLEPGFYGYVGGGPTEIEYTTTDILSGNGYGIGLGYEFTKYVAVEAMYGNLFQLNIKTSSSDLGYEVDGIVLRGILKWPVNENFIPFVSMGSYSITESIVVDGTTFAASGGLTAFGVGVEIPLDEKIILRLLAEGVDNENIVGATVFHIGLMTRF